MFIVVHSHLQRLGCACKSGIYLVHRSSYGQMCFLTWSVCHHGWQKESKLDLLSEDKCRLATEPLLLL